MCLGNMLTTLPTIVTIVAPRLPLDKILIHASIAVAIISITPKINVSVLTAAN